VLNEQESHAVLANVRRTSELGDSMSMATDSESPASSPPQEGCLSITLFVLTAFAVGFLLLGVLFDRKDIGTAFLGLCVVLAGQMIARAVRNFQ
jgi:hypothetical protein